MSALFDPLTIRGITLKNRICVSPMCQYSAIEGVVQDWHNVHLVTRAIGGAALIIAEATAVCPEGRITHGDSGLWNDKQTEAWKPIIAAIKKYNCVPGIQLAHAGRKASAQRPWEGGGSISDSAASAVNEKASEKAREKAWTTCAPSAIAWGEKLSAVPKEMSVQEIHKVTSQFVESTQRALAAGFEWIELHAAHGYLLHSYLSPISNHRTDDYGGSFENRTRFLVETTSAVRAAMPPQFPLAVRISATDWDAGGWTPEDSVKLAKVLHTLGVDLVDCSSGGVAQPQKPYPLGAGYQVFLSEKVKREASVLTAAVGMITSPEQADQIIRSGQADLIFIAREFLRDPYWVYRAAKALRIKDLQVLPIQYGSRV